MSTVATSIWAPVTQTQKNPSGTSKPSTSSRKAPPRTFPLRVRQAFYQATNGLDNDLSDTRLIVEYPLSIL